MRKLVALLGDNNGSWREIEAAVRALGFDTAQRSSGESNEYFIRKKKPEAAICRCARDEAERFVREAKSANPHLRVVLLTEEGGSAVAEAAWAAGAAAWFHLPVSAEVVAFTLRSIPEQAKGSPADGGLIGGREMSRTRGQLARAAEVDCNVLITGETGTGKELAAESIHAGSARRSCPFVCVNCAAIPDALLESELFGYERGAFTGAQARFSGQFQAASGGTLFLDEVADMSLSAQAKVLRAIERREVRPLGSTKTQAANVRIVAATNRNLEGTVTEGRFRSDLFFRLNVVHIRMLPLRERKEDIGALAEHFLRELNPSYRTAVRGLTREALDCLKAHPWPGNVRELRNVIEGVLVDRPGEWVRPGDLPTHLRSAKEAPEDGSEAAQLQQALEAVNWNKSQAAARLKWSRMTVYRKIAKYRIRP